MACGGRGQTPSPGLTSRSATVPGGPRRCQGGCRGLRRVRAEGQELQGAPAAHCRKEHRPWLLRGYFPLTKGKQKGRGKFSPGKGGKISSKTGSVMAAEGKGKQKPGSASYTGCFVCGSKDHDYRSCPERTSAGRGKGASSSTSYMVMNDVGVGRSDAP